MSLYIFDILIYYIYVCVPHFYDLSALVGCWSSVSIRRIIYNFLNVCPIDYTAVSVSGKVERSRTDLTTAVGWLLLLQLIVLSRSAINRCVIAVFVLSRCFLDFSVGVGAFCHMTESDLLLFLFFQKKPQTNKQTNKPSSHRREALCCWWRLDAFVLWCRYSCLFERICDFSSAKQS